MPGDHSKSFEGQGDNTPYVPTWMATENDWATIREILKIGGSLPARLQRVYDIHQEEWRRTLTARESQMIDAAWEKHKAAVPKTDICPGDQRPCYVDSDEPHFRCGTVQCGQKSKSE